MADTLTAGRQDLALVRTKGELDHAHTELAQREDTIHFLLGQIHDKVGPTISTGITLVASGVGGVLDGFLGNNNKVGPVPITLVAGLGAAAASFYSSDPNGAEAFAALARGFAAPAVYILAERATRNHFSPAAVAQRAQQNAMAAQQAPAQTAPKAGA